MALGSIASNVILRKGKAHEVGDGALGLDAAQFLVCLPV